MDEAQRELKKWRKDFPKCFIAYNCVNDKYYVSLFPIEMTNLLTIKL